MRAQVAMEFMIYAGVLTLILAYSLLVASDFFRQQGTFSSYFLSRSILFRISSVLEFMQRTVSGGEMAYKLEIPKAVGGKQYVIYIKPNNNYYTIFLEIPSTGEVYTARVFKRKVVEGLECTSSQGVVVLNSSLSTVYTFELVSSGGYDKILVWTECG